MTTNHPSNKTLAIVGSEANTATASLIYMFGSIQMKMLEKLQNKGIDSYSGAAQELKDMNEELYFYTHKHRVTVRDQISSADGILLVVTSPPQASGAFFPESVVDHIKESVPLFAQKKAIILAKNPEHHEWSESVYNDLVQSARAALQQHNVLAESVLVVPSDLTGENFVEPSPETPWYTNSTLIAALDEMFQ